MRALLLLSFFPFLLGRSGPPGPTLFPGPLQPGEELRFVVDCAVRGEPAGADTLRVAAAGDPAVAEGVARRDGRPWVELAGGGWAPAARLDRPADPLESPPEPGREGLVAGRVLPWDWRPPDLVALPDSLKYPGYEGKSVRLRAEAADAFREMVAAAAADSVVVQAISGWRGALFQRRLYARALARDPDQDWSAAPGRSEHQLGTALDVGTPSLAPLDPGLERSPAGRWLTHHAGRYGFVVSFSRDRHRARGVTFEPWHLRWVGDHVADDSGW
jgi:hypothetical protein